MSDIENISRVQDTTDFLMRRRWEEIESNSPIGTTQLTIRVRDDLKLRLDLMASHLEITRNSLVVELLYSAVEDAINRMATHPYMTAWESGGKTFREIVEEEDNALRLSVGAI